MCAALILGGAFFARRNLRLGRGDRRGAARLAFFIFGLEIISWLFAEHHLATEWELLRFFSAAGYALLDSGVTWMMYIALEPFVRRHWPRVMVGWSRLLAGNFRDPLVGRDLLAAGVLAISGVCMFYLVVPIASLFGVPQLRPATIGDDTPIKNA